MARSIHYPNVENVSTGENIAPLTLLNSIKTIDGSGSGLDADTVDGHEVVEQGTGSGQDPNVDIKLGWNSTTNHITAFAGTNDLGNVITSDDLDGSLPVTGRMYNPAEQLSDSANISWDWANLQVAEVTITANRILSNPINAAAGQYCSLRVNRTGAFVLSFGNNFRGISGITQSSTSGAIDHFVFRYSGTYFELVSLRTNVGA